MLGKYDFFHHAVIDILGHGRPASLVERRNFNSIALHAPFGTPQSNHRLRSKSFVFNQKMAQRGKLAQGDRPQAGSGPAQSIKSVTVCVICTENGATRRASSQLQARESCWLSSRTSRPSLRDLRGQELSISLARK